MYLVYPFPRLSFTPFFRSIFFIISSLVLFLRFFPIHVCLIITQHDQDGIERLFDSTENYHYRLFDY